MYLVIIAYEDGPSITYLTKDELVERLNEDYWGSEINWVSDPRELSLECMHREGVIIKGPPIVPKAVQTVTAYEV